MIRAHIAKVLCLNRCAKVYLLYVANLFDPDYAAARLTIGTMLEINLLPDQ